MDESYTPINKHEVENWKQYYATFWGREFGERALSDLASGEAAKDLEVRATYFTRSAAYSGLAVLRNMEDTARVPAHNRMIKRMRTANYRRQRGHDGEDQ